MFKDHGSADAVMIVRVVPNNTVCSGDFQVLATNLNTLSVLGIAKTKVYFLLLSRRYRKKLTISLIVPLLILF